MNCEKTRELLWAFYEGGLGPARSSGVEEHLGSCGACRQELAAIRQTVSALKLVSIEPRPGFEERLRHKIDAWEERRQVSWVAVLAGLVRRNRRLLATSGVAFAVALFGGMYLLHNAFGPGSVPAEMTAKAPLPSSQGTGYEGIVPVTVTPGAAENGGSQDFVMREIPYGMQRVIISRPDGPDTVYVRFPAREVAPPRSLGRDNYIYSPSVTPVSTEQPIY